MSKLKSTHVICATFQAKIDTVFVIIKVVPIKILNIIPNLDMSIVPYVLPLYLYLTLITTSIRSSADSFYIYKVSVKNHMNQKLINTSGIKHVLHPLPFSNLYTHVTFIKSENLRARRVENLRPGKLYQYFTIKWEMKKGWRDWWRLDTAFALLLTSIRFGHNVPVNPE